MHKFKGVSREEYLEFIASWPNKLWFDCTGVCEPPLGSYNDFSGGKVWPDSIVAKEVRCWMSDNGVIDNALPGKFWRYYVLDTSNAILTQ